jgi:hypothetical protein
MIGFWLSYWIMTGAPSLECKKANAQPEGCGYSRAGPCNT